MIIFQKARKSLLLFYVRWVKGLRSSRRVIQFSFKKYKTKTFLIQAEENRGVTFQELKQLTDNAILFLAEKGLTRKDVAAFTAPNCVEYFIVRAACQCAGIIFFGLPVNLTQNEIARFLDKTRAKILFYAKRGDFDINAVKAKAPLTHFVELKSRLFAEIHSKTSTARPGELKIHNQLATFNLSSATTQRIPKIIQLNDSHWIASFYGYLKNSTARLNKENVFLCAVPYLTAGSTTFLPALAAGFTYIVIKEDIADGLMVNYIKKYQVNRLYITPSRLIELVSWCQANNQRLKSLESIITGTERIPAACLKEAIDFFGPIISVGYGMVEALPPLAILSPQEYPHLESAGRITRGVKIKITADGGIAIKSKTVSRGYLDNADENAKCFKDSWFYSNDYGYIGKDNFLYVLGRKEEILTNEPRRIFAKEIEEKLHELSFIRRCAALAKEKRIFIFASLRAPLDAEKARDKILEIFNQTFGSMFRIEKIIIKESLPINALGKLDRRSLAEEIA